MRGVPSSRTPGRCRGHAVTLAGPVSPARPPKAPNSSNRRADESKILSFSVGTVGELSASLGVARCPHRGEKCLLLLKRGINGYNWGQEANKLNDAGNATPSGGELLSA